MRLHFLVEGPAEKELLEGLLPRLIPRHYFRIYPHQGKGKLPADPNKPPSLRSRALLEQLPAKLRAFGRDFRADADRVVLLVDLDDDDLEVLRRKLDTMLRQLQMPPECLWCFAIEEVEAWYLGDWQAIQSAFPDAHKLAEYSRYEPDSICGTWELFQRVIEDPIERKPHWARTLAPHLSVERGARRNRSPSFRTFCAEVRRFAGEGAPEPRQGRPKAGSVRSKRPARPARSTRGAGRGRASDGR